MIQVPYPATVIVEKESEVAFGVRAPAAGVGLPHPLYATVGEEASDSPLGKLSEKLTFEIEVGPGLVIVNDSVDDPLGAIVFGEKALTILALTMFANRTVAEKSAL